MKKCGFLMVFVLFFAVLMFSACGVNDYSVIVTNNSSKSVTFDYNDSSHFLASGASEAYQVKAHTQPPKNITVSGAISVSMKAVDSGNAYIIEDKLAMKINVLNSLSFDVRLAEKGNCIEDSSGNAFIECQKQTVAGTLSETIGKVYTKTPDFYSLPKLSSHDEYPQYPVSFECNISDDGEMFVSIK